MKIFYLLPSQQENLAINSEDEQRLLSINHAGFRPLAGVMCRLIIPLFLGVGIYACTAQAETDESFQKGICYVTWDKDRYLSSQSDVSLERLAHTGAEWVQIVATQYQEKYNSKKIFPTDKTPSDNSLIHAIKRAHQLGLRVMFKPHIDVLDGTSGLWRADIGFQSQAEWRKWFSGYLKFIRHYARLAESSGVEFFCIGTELSLASTQAQNWKDYIIPGVRMVYTGKIVYAANWDEYKKIKFWDELDYIGIDAYFPLAEKGNPAYEKIRESWMKWADDIEAWQRTINKPVIFTEIGYCSCESSAAKPWEDFYDKKISLGVQADCYRAALDTLSNRQWCKGIYWWYWKTSVFAGGENNRDFTPQNKPAEAVLTSWYKEIFLAGF